MATKIIAVPRVYLDQVALIRLGLPDANAETKAVRSRIENGKITLVLSTAHWQDTAGGDSDEKSRQLSRFIDSLRPVWLRERIDLYRLEMRYFLEGRSFQELREMVICRTVSELVSQIGGLAGGGAVIIETEAMVMHLRRSRQAREIFERSYTTNKDANRQNRKTFNAGKLTPEVEGKARKLAFQKFGGVAVGSAEELRLGEAPPDAMRSLTCEWNATRETWRQGGDMTPNRQKDLFHLVVAMPYTDILVTSDELLRRTIAAVKTQVGFPVTQVVSSLRKLIAVLDRKWERRCLDDPGAWD